MRIGFLIIATALLATGCAYEQSDNAERTDAAEDSASEAREEHLEAIRAQRRRRAVIRRGP